MALLDIRIRYKRGQVKTPPFGKSVMEMPRYAADYGEIMGIKGGDGDLLDVFVGMFPNSDKFFVANMYNLSGKFDEHKCFVQFYSFEAVSDCLRATYKNKEHNIIELDRNQFAWWVFNAKKSAPIHSGVASMKNFNINMEVSVKENNTEREVIDPSLMIYNMRKEDAQSEELLEPMVADDIFADEDVEYVDEQEEAVFDALVIQNKKLPRTSQLILQKLQSFAGKVTPEIGGVTVTAPFKMAGVTQIAVVFEMRDGQTVTVFLHNKDATPSKLAADDMLIAWKWMLNRKDITIQVAKENGKDLSINTVARRIMALVEKNSDRFIKANAKRAEREENIARLEIEVSNKEMELKHLIAEMRLKNEAKKADKIEKENEKSADDAEKAVEPEVPTEPQQDAEQASEAEENSNSENPESGDKGDAGNEEQVDAEQGDVESGNKDGGNEPEAPAENEPKDGGGESDDVKLLKRIADGGLTDEEKTDLAFMKAALEVAQRGVGDGLEVASEAIKALKPVMVELVKSKMANIS